MITRERIEEVRHNGSGFTLIEILIVVAIIAILASVVLIGLGPTQQAGRDARRVSDLQEVQNGLELYYNQCGHYPGSSTCGSSSAGSTWAAFSTTLKGDTTLDIQSVPQDPSNGKSYAYGVNGTYTTYVLEATMENASGTVFNNYTAPSITGLSWSGTAPSSCAAPNYCVTL